MRELISRGLRRFVDRPLPERPRGHRKAKVIALASLKGGVGKTTTSVHLASALARFHDRKTLLIDLDPQGYASSSLARLTEPGGGDLSGVLTAESPGDVLDVVAGTGVPGLFVTPKDPQLGEAENLLSGKMGKELILREALASARTHYDAIVMDCPPNLGNLTANALVACDYLLVPCDLSPLGAEGVRALLSASAQIGERLNPKLDLLGVLITRYDARTASLNKAVLDEFEESLADALLPVRIGVNSSLARSQHEGRDVFDHAPRSRGAEHYGALASEVVKRLWPTS